jgi:hypothetical protein
MPKYKVSLNPARTSYIDKWTFTGKIKYEKFSKRVDIYFEIKYTELDSGLLFGVLSSKEITRRRWVHEKAFYLIELPEIEIYNCN